MVLGVRPDGNRREDRTGDDRRRRCRRRYQCRTRTRPQEQPPRAAVGENCARSIVLRALLHRAQSRSPRQRCDAARSRQCSFRGIVLDILAPQRIRRSEIGWRIESARLRRQGSPALSPRNNIVQAWSLSAALFGTLITLFGWQILPWLLLQALAGITFLEAANYLEHYGLLRARRQDAALSKPGPKTVGTVIISCPICSCTNYNDTVTITRIRVCATNLCAALQPLRNSLPDTR